MERMSYTMAKILGDLSSLTRAEKAWLAQHLSGGREALHGKAKENALERRERDIREGKISPFQSLNFH